MTQETEYYKAINWNAIEDVIDKATWEKLTEQFWLDTRIPLSNDLDDWRKLSQEEKDLVGKVFGGLTLLDTLQSVDGVSAIKPDVRTQHEEAVLNNIEFMECYTKDHKLLTIDRGWIPINQIKEGDTVLAYDKETETTRFEKVTKTSSHFTEHIHHIHAKNFDLKVSGGHRMLFEKAGSSPYTKNSWSKYSSHVLEARDFVDLPRNPLRRLVLARPFESEEKSPLTLQEQFYILLHERSAFHHEEKARIEQYKEGNSSIRMGVCAALFTFQSEDKIKKLYDLCEALGYSIQLKHLKVDSKVYKRFLVSIPLEDYVKNHYDTSTYQDFFSLSDFDSSKVESFLRELTSWCTRQETREDGSLLRIHYHTRNYKDWNFVQAIVTLAGHAFTKARIQSTSKLAKAEMFVVRIFMSEKQNYLHLTRVKTDVLDGEMVYGVEVPSSFLVVLAGDKPVISGNCVHAKSYSSIFSTLNTKSEIEEIFEWTAKNPYLQKKADIIKHIYDTGSPLQKKVASVFLESFLFYSGFFTPLWYLGNNKLANVAEIIKLIIRDECLTGNHELLTPDGWVSIKDIRPKDVVLQFDGVTGTSSFGEVSTISTHYAPKLYDFKSKNGYVNLTCTPNHRLVKRTRSKKNYFTHLASTEGVKSHQWVHSVPLRETEPDLARELSLWDKFYIATTYLGSKVKGQTSKTTSLVVSSRDKDKMDYFKDLLIALEIPYSVYEYSSPHKIIFRVDNVGLYGLEKERIKTLPKYDLTQLSREWCHAYLEEVLYWSGYERIGSVKFSSSKLEDLEWLQEISTLLGYKTRLFEELSVVHKSPRYRLVVITTCNHTEQVAVETRELQGADVYGVSVPTGFVVTRKDGVTCVTGNSVHGTYIGYKFQVAFNELSEEEQAELKEWTYDLLYELYENEELYTEELYDSIGWTDEVKVFLRYNANKALMNLGLDPLFPETAEDVNPIIMNGISTGTSNHDFFSQVGNGYLLGQVEAMEDSDYTVGL